MGVVYFVHGMKSQHIKIGRATDVWARLSGLRSSSPEWLVLLGFIETEDDRGLERLLHESFGHLRRHGEWFEADDGLLYYIGTRTDWEYDPGWEVTGLWHVTSRVRDGHRRAVLEGLRKVAEGQEIDSSWDDIYRAALAEYPAAQPSLDPRGWPPLPPDAVEAMPKPVLRASKPDAPSAPRLAGLCPGRTRRDRLRAYKESRGLPV